MRIRTRVGACQADAVLPRLALVALLAVSIGWCLGPAVSSARAQGGDAVQALAGEMLLTVIPATQTDPGAYARCRGTIARDDNNQTSSRLFCILDAAIYETQFLHRFVHFTVNPAEVAATFGLDPVGASFCNLGVFQSAPADQCGDGQPGAPPPYVDDLWAPGAPASGLFADVNETQAALSGEGNFYDPDLGELHAQGCYPTDHRGPLAGTSLGPYLYVETTVPIDKSLPTAEGTGELWIGQQNCLEPTREEDYYLTVTLTPEQDITNIAPQNQWDSDRDGCSETQELRDTKATGGLRDPFNPWDFLDVPSGTGLARNRSVNGGDIAAIVGRFGANDVGAGTFDRYSDLDSTPNAPISPAGARANYHPAYDRGGSLVGSNPWNLKPANGAISGGDIGAVVGQFGHHCTD
ncbi:MAG: flexitail domain-containing putative surface protein [Solirubrobacterales bacterium]